MQLYLTVSNSFDILSDTETYSQPFSPNITSPFLPKVHSSPNSIIPPFISTTPLSSTPSIENSASPSSGLPSHDNVKTPTSIPMSPTFHTPDLSSGFSYSKSKKKGNWRTLIINANGVLSRTAEICRKSKSGILINDISDHKIIFTFQENLSYIEKTEKYIYTEKYDDISMQQFITELNNSNIYEQLNQNIDSSPQENYEIFSKFVKRAKDMYLPKRKVKYNKKRHMKSSWMTRGILNSINTKNMLYKIFIQADS